MMRFVLIASLKRGAIEPAELLDYVNQGRAIERYEADEYGPQERVIWRSGYPKVVSAYYRPTAEEKCPQMQDVLGCPLSGLRG